DAREAVEALWTPLSKLQDPSQHALRSVPGLPKEMRFPAIELNGIPLWGFTYRVITDWLGLGPKEGSVERAGFEMAGRLLDFLISQGLTLKHGWHDWIPQQAAGEMLVKAATVNGVIPVTPVLAHFSASGQGFSLVNLLEVRPEHIRVVGRAFE